MNFGGIYPALLTPFDKKDCIHKSVLEELVEFNLKKA